MRNREAVSKKVEGIESNLAKMGLRLNQGDREACFELITDIREQISQIQLYLESEPMTGQELNR